MEISGRSVRIVYTGLREGEKMHEGLFGPGERDHRPTHPAVSHVAVPPLPIAWAEEHVMLVGAEQAMIDLPLFPSPTPDGSLLPMQRQAS